jgi:thymidylate synthase
MDQNQNKTTDHPEYQYLNLLKEIMEKGEVRSDRTGTGTKSLFGVTMRYDLSNDTIPVMTTKRVHWKSVVEELLWFIRGSTNEKELSAAGVKIWSANGSRSFLDQRGFYDREEGDLGPVYGFQWRHFGAKYTNCHADYTGQGVDQLKQVMDLIKTDPSSRRIILCAWNPADMNDMALPPCHCFVQFYVTSDKKLKCMMTQRSADMGLGVPFNVASYSLLTHMIAKACDLTAGEFVHCIGDAHVYLNHIEPLTEQVKRVPRPFPKLKIAKDLTSVKLEELTFEDLQLVDYDPHPIIKMQMAV